MLWYGHSVAGRPMSIFQRVKLPNQGIRTPDQNRSMGYWFFDGLRKDLSYTRQ